MRESLTSDQRAARAFANHHGVICGDDARAAGLSQRQVDLRVEGGRWRRPVRDVFVLVGSPDTWQQRATVASFATREADGVLSHVTVGAVHGAMRPSPLPHVTVPPGRSRRTGVAKAHQGIVPPEDRTHWEGLVVTTPSRLLVDMAALLARPSLEELVDHVLCRGLASVDSVLRSSERSTMRRGQRLLRSVLDVWTPLIEPGSVAEVRLLRLLRELGLTDVVTQNEVYDAAGVFLGRLDIAVPRLRAGLEYDSVAFHDPRRWARDEARDARLRDAGWDVHGVTKADLIPGQTRLADIAARWQRAIRAAS